jgi:putative transposase
VTLLADNTLSGEKVAAALNKALLQRGTPESITVNNGTDFTSKALDHWAYKNGVHLDFIRPGRPVENGYIESFNGKLRDECLNAEVFFGLADARRKLYSGGATTTTNARTPRWTSAPLRSSRPPSPLMP